MTSDEDGLKAPADIFKSSVFKLGSQQVSAILQLAHALRTDQNVSDETRLAASKVFDGIEEMITQLTRISDASWSISGDSAENNNDR